MRLFHRTELHWARQVAQDETALDCGMALINPALPLVREANQVFEAFVPDGMTPGEVVEMIGEPYGAAGVRCLKWTLNPSMPPQRIQPLEAHLLEHGFRWECCDLMYLKGRPAGAIEEVAGIKIIPARASFRHARQMAEEVVAHWNTPGLVEAMMMHVEDPHTDALLALKDAQAAALLMVQAVGDLGCIAALHVSERCRGEGLGRTMMSRALEICARSLFKHVFLTVDPTNATAIALYRKCGFEKIGDFAFYRG